MLPNPKIIFIFYLKIDYILSLIDIYIIYLCFRQIFQYFRRVTS